MRLLAQGHNSGSSVHWTGKVEEEALSSSVVSVSRTSKADFKFPIRFSLTLWGNDSLTLLSLIWAKKYNFINKLAWLV